MSYTTLQADVADRLHRTDLTAKIPGFIALAEQFMFRELNLREIETSVTGTTSGANIPLPADFHTLIRITVDYGGREITLDKATDHNAYGANSSLPTSYDMQANAIRLYPAPGTGYAYTMYYQPTLAPLSNSVATNWLETNAADLYLNTSVLEAARWCEDDALIARVSPLIGPMMDSVRKLSERKALPQRGTMQIKPRR